MNGFLVAKILLALLKPEPEKPSHFSCQFSFTLITNLYLEAKGVAQIA